MSIASFVTTYAMLFIVVIACLFSLVWGTLLLVRGSLLGGCLIVLLLSCCFGPHFFSFELGGVTLTLDRIGWLVLIAACIIQWRLGSVRIKPLMSVDYFVLALFAILVVSTFTHSWRGSGGDAEIVQHLINGYLVPMVVYFIARQSPLNERNVTMVMAAMACFGLYLSVTGILEAHGQWSYVVPRYISDPEIGLHFGRARGPMVQSVSYGLYLSTCLLCAWLWRERLGPRWQWLLLLLLPAFFAAVFYSKTRSVWIGSLTGMLIILWFTLHRRARIVVVGSALVIGLMVGVAKRDQLVAFDRGDSAENTRRSTSMRGSFAYVSWLMFQDRPLWGFGFGQFEQAKLPYLSDRSTQLNLESIRPYAHHNTFLSLLTETGLIGLTALLAVYIGWARAGLSLVGNASVAWWVRQQGLLLLGVLGIAFWQMVGHEITFTPLDHSLIFFIAGVSVGLVAEVRLASGPVRPRTAERLQPAFP